MKKLLAVVFCGVLASASISLGAYVEEDFESGTKINELPGWQAPDTVTVDGGVALFPSSSAATNAVNEDPATVWTDFEIIPALGVEPVSPATDEAAVLFYFDDEGNIVVWNAGISDWSTCSNDVWGVDVENVSDTSVRISIYQDYRGDDETFALFLDGHCLIQDVPFPAGADGTTYGTFAVQNVDSNATVDNVWIKVAHADDTLLPDIGPVTDYSSDLAEMDALGYVTRKLYVGGDGSDSEYPAYDNITDALAVYRDGDVIQIDAGYVTTTEDVAILGGTDRTEVTFAGDALTVASLSVNSGVTVSFAQALTVSGTLTANDEITLAANTSVDTFYANADVTLTGGADLTVTTLLDLNSTATLTASITGSDITSADIDMESGTSITVAADGTLSATAGDLEFAGGFTIDGGDWDTTGDLVAQTLPTSDSFEGYIAGRSISKYGMYGWSASATSVIVTNDVAAASVAPGESTAATKSLYLPDGTIATNLIDSGSATRIWTTYYLRPSRGAEPATPTGSFGSYVDEDGYLVVYDGITDAWITCSDNNQGVPLDDGSKFAEDAFRRVAIFQSFGSDTFAVFVDDGGGNLELLREQVGFPEAATTYSSFVIDASDSEAYIDRVVISVEIPDNTNPYGAAADTDGDGETDTLEIATKGFLADPGGTIFKFS